MKRSTDIQNELRDMSPVVANIPLVQAYQVPNGYFEALAEQVIKEIALQQPAASVSFLPEKKEQLYEVPPGYFEGFASTVINRIKATQSASAKDELEILSPLLGSLNKKNPFSTPKGYFEDLPENVIVGVKAIDFVHEELEILSPLMLEAQAKNVYTVPHGYFDTIAVDVLNKIKTTQQPAKVVSIAFNKKLLRYAVAAAIIGLVAIGGWVFIFNNTTIVEPPSAVVEKGMKKVSDDEILSFVENSSVSVEEAGTITLADIKPEDAKDMLADVSDEELQQYLERQTGTKEIITN